MDVNNCPFGTFLSIGRNFWDSAGKFRKHIWTEIGGTGIEIGGKRTELSGKWAEPPGTPKSAKGCVVSEVDGKTWMDGISYRICLGKNLCPLKFQVLFWSIKTTSYNHFGGGMFIHFCPTWNVYSGGGHLENREKCMPWIPQEWKWKLGKMYEAEGGGGPRLYIFKGVGLTFDPCPGEEPHSWKGLLVNPQKLCPQSCSTVSPLLSVVWHIHQQSCWMMAVSVKW